MRLDIKFGVCALLSIAISFTVTIEGTTLKNGGGEGYPILDISPYIHGFFHHNSSEAKELLRKTLKEELSPTLYLETDSNQDLFETFNETIVQVSHLIAETDSMNSVDLERKIILALGQFRHNEMEEADFDADTLSAEAFQVLSKSLEAIIIQRKFSKDCADHENSTSNHTIISKPLSLLASIHRLTNVRLGYGFTMEHSSCHYFKLASYVPSDIAIMTINLTAQVGFGESYQLFRRTISHAVLKNSYFYHNHERLTNPITPLVRLSLMAHEGKYNEEFRSYQSLLRQYVTRWKSDNKGKNIIVNMINGYEPSVMFPVKVQDEQEDSWEKVGSATIPYLFLQDLKLKYGHSCLNVGLSQIASRFDTVLLDFDSWRHILLQNDTVSNWYKKVCEKSDLEASNLKAPSNVTLLVNLKECEDNSCDSIKQVLTLIGNNTTVRGMTVKSVIFSLVDEEEEDELPKNISNNILPTLGCFANIGNLEVASKRKSVNKCPLSNFGTESVSIWEIFVDFGRSSDREGIFSFYKNSIQGQLYKIYEKVTALRRVHPEHEVILKLVPYPSRWNANRDGTLFCDRDLERVHMLLQSITIWAHIHKMRVILKPTFDTESAIGWWSRLGRGESSAFVARNYPKNSNFGSDPCLDWEENLMQKVSFDEGTGITVNMGMQQKLKGEKPLSVDELKMLTTLALHVSSTVEILTRGASVNKSRHDLETITELILDTNFYKHLELNKIKNGKLYIGIPHLLLMSDPRNTLDKFLSAFRHSENLSKFELAGIHVTISKSTQYEPSLGIIIEQIKGATSFGVVCGLDSNFLISPNLVGWVEKASYLVMVGESYLVVPGPEKFSLQRDFNNMLELKKTTLSKHPNLGEIFFRPGFDIYESQWMVKCLIESRYLRLLSYYNSFGKAYNISTFIYGFDQQQSMSSFEDETLVGWWSVANYSDLSNRSVYSEKQASYFNEPSWRPEYGNHDDT